MFNITDIEKRLKQYPEPDEIKEIRENIINSFKALEFIEEGHKYFLHNDDGTTTEMTSVSHVCHRYEPFTDWDLIAEKKADKLGIEVEELKRQWKENNIRSTSNGSLTHLFAEAYMWFYLGQPDKIPQIIKDMQYEEGFLIPYGKKQEAVMRFYEDLSLVPQFYPVMPETQIYIKADDNPFGIKHNISGTFDALFAFKAKDGKYKLSVFDWKTNKSLENEWNNNFNVTLLPPFDNMDFIDQPKSLYTIQLNLYSLGLMQLGYEIADRKLLWLTDDGNYQKIQVPSVTETLIEDLSKEITE